MRPGMMNKGFFIFAFVAVFLFGCISQPTLEPTPAPSTGPNLTPQPNFTLRIGGYYEDYPAWWIKVSTGNFGRDILDSYQCALHDDFYGTGEKVTIANYHHGRIGLFMETNASGTWTRTPVHEIFNDTNADGFPIKGIFQGDLDLDGRPEIFTAHDYIYFSPAHLENVSRKQWTGTMYIDLNEGKEPVIQNLVWGMWGEKITGEGPIFRPRMLEPEFRQPGNTKPDLLLNTIFASGNYSNGRLFILEQPPEGFGSVNYTFDSTGRIGVFPYEEEPFYVKRLYLQENGEVGELIWNASSVPGAGAAMIDGFQFDSNGDELLDLVVGGTFFDPQGNFVLSRVSIYNRLPSLNHSYLFELNYSRDFPNSHLWAFGGACNCDGNPGNGKESAVFLFSNRDNTSQAQRPTGLMVLKPRSGGFECDFIKLPLGSYYPYDVVYSHAVIFDWNGDGYDDVVQWIGKKAEPYGDVVLWLNTGDYAGHSYSYEPDHSVVLLENESIDWGLSPVQLDADDEPEISVCALTPDHYWSQIQGAKYAYAMDVGAYLREMPGG